MTTVTENHRSLLDAAMREYLKLKEEGFSQHHPKRAGARHVVRAYATSIALWEGNFHPDRETSVKRAESMSLARIRGQIERHLNCGGLILVNGMCAKGHDPAKPWKS